MGKYMRKAKITADVAVMEIPQSTTLGVRTRAKTLALQTLQSSSSSSIAAASPVQPSNVSDSKCYLQLRSRRLLKTLLLIPQSPKSIPQKPSCKQESRTISNPRSNSRLHPNDPTNSGPVPVGSGSISCSKDVEGETRVIDDEAENNFDLGLEASFGENNLDFEATGRSTRESTPCSLIRDVAVTPGSSTRHTNLNACSHITQDAILRNIPLAYEMEEFFSRAEQQQQQQFVEKYNFDIRTDMPLPGRYEWVRVNQ